MTEMAKTVVFVVVGVAALGLALLVDVASRPKEAGASPRDQVGKPLFEDFDAFLRHQTSDHHEEASPRIGEICEDVKLEWVDPVPEAADAPPTEMQPLPEGADEKTALYHRVFAAKVQPWWRSER